MAALTLNRVTRAGIVVTPVAADAGLSDTFVNDGRTVLMIVNGGGSPCLVTYDLAVDPNDGEPTQSTSATANSVAAGTTEYQGPFPTNKFGAVVTVNYDQVATVTVAPIAV